jgi:hypothetical protein
VHQPNDDHFVGVVRRDPFGPRANSALTAVAVIGVLLSMPLGSASAATQVRGQQDDLQIDTQNASIREVLDALSAKFKLTYKLPPGIGRSLTGLYSGTLYRALARILDGNDYFLEVSDGGVKVVVLGASGTIATPAISQAVAVSENTIAPLAPSTPVGAPTPVPAASKSSSPPPLSNYLSASGSAAAGQGANSP